MLPRCAIFDVLWIGVTLGGGKNDCQRGAVRRKVLRNSKEISMQFATELLGQQDLYAALGRVAKQGATL